MAHEEQREFILDLKEEYPSFFSNVKVLDVGSLDINGSIKNFFSNSDYTGIDIGEGKNVDIVVEGQKFDAEDETYDVVASCECFEHNPYWKETFQNMIRMCKSGGLIFMSCATEGRPEHGTINTDIGSSPLTVAKGWNYYRNLTEKDFRDIEIEYDVVFDVYDFFIDKFVRDLYFYGIKK